MKNSRPSHNIDLVGMEGQEIKAVVKMPSVETKSEYRKLDRKIMHNQEEYSALVLESEEINKEIAKARLSPKAKDLEAALAKRTKLDQELDRLDAESAQLIIDRAKCILTISKGDNDTVPEVDWKNCDAEALEEARLFFWTGKA